jgi:lipoyl(octanoyl) transferase
MEFKVINLDLVDFKQAYVLQKDVFQEVKNRHFNAALILCRHYPVITLGRQAKKENIRLEPQELERAGITSFKIERGGDVTYHGPGQIVAYPIFNLAYFKKDIHLFLRKLEDVGIGLLSDLGIKGERQKGFTGVWIGRKKIASIGIAIRNWITFHGMSINIRSDDLANFKFIKPCGLEIEMTCLETITGKSMEMDYLNAKLANRFKETFLTAG